MNVLYVDTTTSDLVVALIKDDDVISVSQKAMGVKHSETLCGKVDELFKAANISFNGIDAYACAIGPGSFTGIRIGISTVKGYATACSKPFIAVNCLEAIAHSVCCGGTGSSVINAGNGYYYYNDTEGVYPAVVPYDDEKAQSAVTADGAVDYLDGATIIIRHKFYAGQFNDNLTPLYIRKSQAEINLKKADD